MAFYETRNSVTGFRCSFYRHNTNLQFHAHLHNSFELLRVKSGSISVRIEKQDYLLTAGEQILIPPNLIHAYDSGKEGSVTQFIIFSADYLPELTDMTRAGELRYPVLDSASYEVFDELLKHRREHYLFRSALYRIAAFYEQNDRVAVTVRRDSDFTRWMSDYLETHCTDPIDEKGVSREIGYHPRYLSSLINRNFGMSFQCLLSEYRVRLAAKLLSEAKASITEVYMAAGFESQSSFNRNFKRIMGVTPREYRRETHGREA